MNDVQQKKNIDLEDYLAQLEIKMKCDEEEIRNYERELSKHNTNSPKFYDWLILIKYHSLD